MRHLTRKLVAVVLTAVMLLSLFPVSVFASETPAAKFMIGTIEVTDVRESEKQQSSSGSGDDIVIDIGDEETEDPKDPLLEEEVSIDTTFPETTKLGDALAAAAKLASHQENGRAAVVLTESGSIDGSYTIPAGVTLLIPHDDTNTVLTRDSIVPVKKNPNDPENETKAYRTLTMTSGAELVAEEGATICVGGQMNAYGTGQNSWNGAPVGGYGAIKMESGSKIVMESASYLYAWGYIYGNVTAGNSADDDLYSGVIAESGANVFEMFQIRDWGGGSDAYTNLMSGYQNYGTFVFPINQYYVQNIEVPLKMKAGAEEYIYSTLAVSSEILLAYVDFIGPEGMFQMDQSGDNYLIKDYVEAEDRLDVQVYGDSKLSSIGLTIVRQDRVSDPLVAGVLTMVNDQLGGTISTEEFTLPLMDNISIEIKSGTTELVQSMEMLPGCQISIDKGATLSINEAVQLYVYDRDDLSEYDPGTKKGLLVTQINHTPSTDSGSPAVTRSYDNLADSAVNINGTLEVNGGFYTSDKDGAKVYSSGNTGKILYASDDSTLNTATGTTDHLTAGFDGAATFGRAYITGSNGEAHQLATDNDNETVRGVIDFYGGLSVDETTGKVTVSESSAQFKWRYADGDEYTIYPDLQAALKAVKNKYTNTGEVTPETVIQVTDGLVVGDVTIPEGVTVLIPYSEDNTTPITGFRSVLSSGGDTSTLGVIQFTYEDPFAYRTLKMIEGSYITVEGGAAICVAGQVSGTGQETESHQGSPTGGYGAIEMSGDSTITLEKNAELYAWGYIYDNGNAKAVDGAITGGVIAEGGSKVNELFQLTGWRGGHVSKEALAPSDNSEPFFPVNQYYVQNIEVPLLVQAGASEFIHAAVGHGTLPLSASVEFIGNDGMFKMDDDCYVIKDYLEATDRLDVQIYGNASLSAISLELAPGMALSTAGLTLPLTNNITVSIMSDETEIIQDLAMLPGCVLNVEEGATLTIGKDADGNEYNVYVYDAETDWNGKSYAASPVIDETTGEYVPVDYIPVAYTPCSQQANKTPKTLADAEVKIDGTVKVTGGFYTHENGSNVHGSGKIVYESEAPESTYVTEGQQTGTTTVERAEVQFGRVCINNGDGTYTALSDEGQAGTYDLSKAADSDGYFVREYWVRWYDSDGELLYSTICQKGTVPVFSADAAQPSYTPDTTLEYTYSDYIGWATAPGSETIAVEKDAAFPAVPDDDTSPDIAYYAVNGKAETEYTLDLFNNSTDTTPRFSFNGENGTHKLTYTQLSQFIANPDSFYTDAPTYNTDDQFTGNFADAILNNQLSKVKNDVNVKDHATGKSVLFDKWVWKEQPNYTHIGYCSVVAATKEYNTYLAIGLNEDGTLAWTQNVYEGRTPTLPDLDPGNTDIYTSVAYWTNLGTGSHQAETVVNPTDTTANGLINIYQATYDRTPRQYTVVWQDWNGQELHRETGVSADAIDNAYATAAYAVPEKTADFDGSFPEGTFAYTNAPDYRGKAVRTSYIDKTWGEPVFDVDTLTCTFKASYTPVTEYLVLWFDDDEETVLKAEYYPLDSSIDPIDEAGAPAKTPSGDRYTYVDGRWTSKVSSDVNPVLIVKDSTNDKYATVNYNCFVAAYTKKLIFYHTLTLDTQNIGLVFYVNLGDYTADQVNADITWHSGSETGLVGVDTDNGIRFSVKIAAKEIFDKVTINVHLNDDSSQLWSDNYSVAEYAYYSIGEYPDRADLVELCHSILAYGNAAKTFFNYSSPGEVEYTDSSYSVPTITGTTDQISDYRYVFKSSQIDALRDQNLNYYGCALTLGSEGAFTLYFRRYEGEAWPPQQPAAKYTNGDDADVTLRFIIDYIWACYDMSHPASRLFDDVVLTINGAEYTVNAKSYLAMALDDKTATAEEIAVLSALYNYSMAAKDYFPKPASSQTEG